MAAKKSAKTNGKRKYGELAAELDDILSGIEEGEIDVDDLSERVERATELIRICRERLTATQTRVKKVVAALEEEPEAEGDADDKADGELPF